MQPKDILNAEPHAGTPSHMRLFRGQT